MAGKPSYVKDLETELGLLKQAVKEQRENQDNILLEFNDHKKILNEIHNCLAGTEFDQSDGNGKGGGVVRRLGRVEKKCSDLETWKTSINTRNAVVWAVVGAVLTAVWTIIVKSWDKLFG